MAAVGGPGEWIELDPFSRPGETTQRAKVGVLVSAQGEYHRAENGFDYIDIIATREPGTVIPNSFRGVSGGALWRFRDVFHVSEPMTELRREDYVFSGIVFWEDLTDPDHLFIRSHGPRSIYERFLPEVREWLRTRTRTEES